MGGRVAFPISTRERIETRTPYIPADYKKPSEIFEEERLKLSKLDPRFETYSRQNQIRYARRSISSQSRRDKQSENVSGLKNNFIPQPVIISSGRTFFANEIEALRKKLCFKKHIARAPYHEIKPSRAFFRWLNQIVQSVSSLPRRFKVAYCDKDGKEKTFSLSLPRWLKWLFSDNSIHAKDRKKLEMVGYTPLSKLGIGNFNELRVGLALLSLKSAGIIKDFILSKKFGTDDELGIDALAIIHEDREGYSLSVPLQVKSRSGSAEYNYANEADYLLTAAQSEYLGFGEEKKYLTVSRNIPMIKATGHSIRALKEQIIELITKSFDKDKFLQFFGKFETKSFVHKLKLLLEQGFMNKVAEIKVPDSVKGRSISQFIMSVPIMLGAIIKNLCKLQAKHS